VTNWLFTAALVVPTFGSLAGIVLDVHWARPLLVVCSVTSLLTRCAVTLSHLLLWLIWPEPHLSNWMLIETSLSLSTIVLGVVVLYFAREMREAPTTSPSGSMRRH